MCGYLPRIIEKIPSHNVLPYEAEEVFSDRNNVWKEDVGHSTSSETRFLIIGKTEKGRLLYQIFTRRGNKIRVISSRDARKKKEVVLCEETT
jgi:uncharacterized protein